MHIAIKSRKLVCDLTSGQKKRVKRCYKGNKVAVMTMTMKKGNARDGLLLVCAMVVAFAAVAEAAGKLSPANCMAECMEICPKDNNNPCQDKCKGMCEVLKAVHEEGMGGNAGGHDQKQGASTHDHQHKHAKTAHNGKHAGGKTAEGDSEHAFCKSACMPTCASMRSKRPDLKCDLECDEYCKAAVKYVETKKKSKN